jgi:hypothetical protein
LHVNNPFGCRKTFKIEESQATDDIQIEVKNEGETAT